MPVGSKLKFGKHQIENEEPQSIEWRIVEHEDDKITFLADKIIDFKSYSSIADLGFGKRAPSTICPTYINSDICCWLNSQAEAGGVKYKSKYSPVRGAVNIGEIYSAYLGRVQGSSSYKTIPIYESAALFSGVYDKDICYYHITTRDGVKYISFKYRIKAYAGNIGNYATRTRYDYYQYKDNEYKLSDILNAVYEESFFATIPLNFRYKNFRNIDDWNKKVWGNATLLGDPPNNYIPNTEYNMLISYINNPQGIKLSPTEINSETQPGTYYFINPKTTSETAGVDYARRCGFLHYFNENEIQKMVVFSGIDQYISLPSAQELAKWNVSLKCEITNQAIENSNANRFYCYTTNSSALYYTIEGQVSGVTGQHLNPHGIRPMMNLKTNIWVSDEVDETGCYLIRYDIPNFVLPYVNPIERYLSQVSGSNRPAVKVEWLDAQENVLFDFTNALYDISVNLDVNYQNGSRSSCTLTLNNDRNQFGINLDSISIGKKFKLYMGIYLNDGTPYYFPKGVFYITNPTEVYSPTNKTISIQGVDKWAYLDGSLNGVLTETYKTAIGVDLVGAAKSLVNGKTRVSEIHLPKTMDTPWYTITLNSTATWKLADTKNSFSGILCRHSLQGTSTIVVGTIKFLKDTILSLNHQSVNGHKISIGSTGFAGESTYSVLAGREYNINYYYSNVGSAQLSFQGIHIKDSVDPCSIIHPSDYYSNSEYTEKIKSPYTIVTERGRTYADILLEYATILCANIYYDTEGHLRIEPMRKDIDDILDDNKEVLWDYSINEPSFIGISQTYGFDKVYNDFIVLGNVLNGYQFKGRVQNTNLLSDTSVQRIGLKSKEPIEDNQYTSDEQCRDLALYYAMSESIMNKSGTITSIPLYHLDVNKIVTVSTPSNDMNRERYLVTGYSLNSDSNTMSLNVVAVKELTGLQVV